MHPFVFYNKVKVIASSAAFEQERTTIMSWKNMPLSHKIASVIAGLAVVVWLIPTVQPNLLPIDPSCPAIAVFTVCEAVICWNQKRKWAYLLIVGAVISMACFMLEWLL